MAAKALSDFTRAKQSPHLMAENSSEYSRKFVEFMKSADDKQRINEYAWLIKGFFEIGQGTEGCMTLSCVEESPVTCLFFLPGIRKAT